MNGIDFIAEISSNHHCDIQRCLKFIDTAADIGCSAVKFQLFKVRELFAPEVLKNSEKHRRRQAWELPVGFLPVLAQHCRVRNLLFSCTPFYLDAVAELEPYVDFYKIASYELLWHRLLQECAATGKPVVLSTGMATLSEVEQAVSVLQRGGCREVTLLHCVSGYPAPAAECNLAAIATLRSQFGCPVGWSDHSADPAVILRAVHKWGARVVEFHLDLDGSGEEFASGHCWLPELIGRTIAEVGRGLIADGTGEKSATPAELADRSWRADPEDGLRPLMAERIKWRTL